MEQGNAGTEGTAGTDVCRPRLGAVALGPDPVNGASPWGCCAYCGQPIYTSYYKLPAVRGRRGVLYTLRVHDSCYHARRVVAQ